MSNTKILEGNEIEEILSNQYIGRLACCLNNKPYIVPITYCYDKSTKSIIGYSGTGLKITILKKNPNVCFEVEDIHTINDWNSVIVDGVYEELKGADARNAVHTFVNHIRQLLHKNSSGTTFLKDISHTEISNETNIIYRINIISKTGRKRTIE
ncbi:MAG TPA: pyridoxamine 5'-phosphate oxidase family protein [Cytophagaceae bacterium]|jgi:nitroimidazol reductase NimA-like FMN-containing flavoprotein (pyridoxamine 5'-phosphate oxidase superfamily)|nr:pyridoxamine 5'-phosphate oxidase family protein [Cytophagaceae bacterium]